MNNDNMSLSKWRFRTTVQEWSQRNNANAARACGRRYGCGELCQVVFRTVLIHKREVDPPRISTFAVRTKIRGVGLEHP